MATSKEFLDKTGLTYLWGRIKSYITSVLPSAGSTTPAMDGTGATGSSAAYARADHVHPSDSSKVDKVSGKGLSTNDYTTAEKEKLAGIAAGATAVVLSTNISSDSTSDAKAATPKAVVSYVASQVGTLWTFGGSVAFANLPAANSTNVNKIYNVTDSFTTTSSFVEGAGKVYPAGTNVAVVNLDGSYKYDVLSGLIDTSAFLTENDLTTISEAEITAIVV